MKRSTRACLPLTVVDLIEIRRSRIERNDGELQGNLVRFLTKLLRKYLLREMSLQIGDIRKRRNNLLS